MTRISFRPNCQHARVRKTHRVLKTLLLVILPVTLRDRQPVVDIPQVHPVVGDVSDEPSSSAALQRLGFLRKRIGPHFDAGALGRVRHADVAHEDVFHVVDARGVLSQTADGDAVRAVALEVLHEDVGAVRLERDTIWTG